MPYADPKKRREMARLYTQRYRERNRDLVRKRDREAKRRLREAGLLKEIRHTPEYQRDWRQRNLERCRKRDREWAREYHRKNPGARQARLFGIPNEWAAVLRTDPCSYCGGPAGELDHITPVAAGGGGGEGNATAACRSCNASKSDDSVLTFLLRRCP